MCPGWGTVRTPAHRGTKARHRTGRNPFERTEPRPPAATERILVADDNREIADLLAELLASLGHAVDTYDGAQARAAIEAAPPRCAILDISMPGLDGCALARWVRACPDGATIRLVAMTGHCAADERARILDAGFDEVLAKPLDLDRLRRPVCGSLPRRSAAA